MKAIQIKYLPATNFKGARMKAWIEGGHSITLPFQYEISSDEVRAKLMATELKVLMNWCKVEISGIGQLPNGDWVATLKGVE
jgi:hypothetical protein